MDVPSALVSTIYDPETDPAPWWPEVQAEAGERPARGKLSGIIPAGGLQPVPGAAQPGVPGQPGVPAMPPPEPLPGQGGANEFEAPRGPITIAPIGNTGYFTLRANDPRDMNILLMILRRLEEIAKAEEPDLRLVPLKHQDCNTIAGTLNSVFARVVVGGTGNYVPGQARAATPGNALSALTGAPSGTQTVYCIAMPRFNSLLIAGPKGRFDDILREVEKLDRPNEAPIRAFQLKKASAQVVGQQIRQLYSQRFPQEGPPNMQFRISYDLSSNTVLVQASPADMKDIAELIDKLDNLTPLPTNDIKIFRLQNALADELAAVLIQSLTANVVNPVTQSAQPWYIQTVTGQSVGALGGVAALAGGGGIGGAGGIGGLQGGAGGIGGLQGGAGGIGTGGIGGAGGLGGLGVGIGGAGGTAGLNAVIPQVGQSSGGGLTTKTNALRFSTVRDGKVIDTVETGFLEDVHIVPNARTNSLLVAARPETMKLIEKLVESLDTVAAARAYINVFSMKTADATLTALLLQQLFTGSNRTGLTPTGGGGAGGAFGGGALGQAGAGGVNAATGVRPLLTLSDTVAPGATLIDLRITVDDRTNSLIVAGSLNDLETIRAIVARLEGQETQQRYHDVYKLRNAAAADVATSLQTFLTNSLAVYTGATLASSYQQLLRNVVIVPEPVSNTILISATPQYFGDIRRMIERIDAQPPQVMIQVLIAEVQLTNNEEFGVEFGIQSPVLFQRSGAPGTPGFNFNTTPQGPLGNAANVSPDLVGFQGLQNLGVGRTSSSGGAGGLVISAQSDAFNLLIRALKAQGRIDVLSRPQIQVADSQTGFVQVGQDFPVPTSIVVSGTGLSQSGIDYRSIGITMRVTPRVNPDGKVLMRVEPAISTLGPIINVSATTSAPSFNVDTVQTTVLASDGETIVLGGLISRQDNRNETGIPFFKDIPYVGSLFRYRTRALTKREVLVIMTPHIVRTEYDAARILAEEARRMNWCVPDVAKIHGHGMEVIGPAMQGANPVPVGGVPPGTLPPGSLPAGFGPGFVPPATVPGPAFFDTPDVYSPPGMTGPAGPLVLPPGAVVPGAPVPGPLPVQPLPTPIPAPVQPLPAPTMPPGAVQPGAMLPEVPPAMYRQPAGPSLWPAAGVVTPAGAVVAPAGQLAAAAAPPSRPPYVMVSRDGVPVTPPPPPAPPAMPATANRGFTMVAPPAPAAPVSAGEGPAKPARPTTKVTEDRPWNGEFGK